MENQYNIFPYIDANFSRMLVSITYNTPNTSSCESGLEFFNSTFPQTFFTINPLKRIWAPSDPPKVCWCIPPLYKGLNLQLSVEIIELHRILGVSQAFAYNRSLTPKESILLKFYQYIGFIKEIIQFDYPDADQYPHLVDTGFHDCLLRTMGICRHSLYIDIDEIVIPKTHDNYKFFIRDLLLSHPSVEYRIFHDYYLTDMNFLNDWRNETKVHCGNTRNSTSKSKPELLI